ncbi:hypothetical protein H107_04664 [Trichophyton rubrum CBS 202.88]|nr:hypothetical protein H107_04664 [Trichophyton rubrum CBS 202.88]
MPKRVTPSVLTISISKTGYRIAGYLVISKQSPSNEILGVNRKSLARSEICRLLIKDDPVRLLMLKQTSKWRSSDCKLAKIFCTRAGGYSRYSHADARKLAAKYA